MQADTPLCQIGGSMIKISDIKLPVEADHAQLIKKAAHEAGIRPEDIRECEILRRSLDARRKPDLYYIYTVLLTIRKEEQLRIRNRKHSGRSKHNNIMFTDKEKYVIPTPGDEALHQRPVIIGSGPAGLFAAYVLALSGYKPLILERGADALTRTSRVEHFWTTGELDTQTNVQFGEGGAGTFSDGKLNTSVKDPGCRARFMKETFVLFGADESILYEQKPHVGTDVLTRVLVRMRERLTELGAEYRFLSQVTNLEIQNGRLTAVIVNNSERIPAEVCVLAPGHSARDTFRMLHERGLRMEPKAFAAGVRIEHPQAMIDLSQYGRPQDEHLGPAPYKLTHTAADGRGVYSFCMCPGGYVVNASSEKGLLAVNGMSYMKRDSANANSAILVTVTPEDFMPMRPDDLPDALAGTAFQAELEKKAYAAAGGRIPQQLYSDFMNKTASSNYGEFASCVRGGAAFADLNAVMPSFMARDIGEGISAFGKKIRGFDRHDAILSGIESRSSSPVRITRDEKYVSNIDGIYPCGEGCGYAGGITSASMDGMRCAEAIIKRFRKLT